MHYPRWGQCKRIIYISEACGIALIAIVKEIDMVLVKQLNPNYNNAGVDHHIQGVEMP